MNELKILNNTKFGEIRTVVHEGKPYAVGVDLARALGYARPSQAVIKYCKNPVKLPMHSGSGSQMTTIIPKGDIYRLIARATRQGMNPAIRERGAYFEKLIFDEPPTSIE